MALTGVAKRDYQRVYMVKRRSNKDFREEENARARTRNGNNGLTCELCGYGETVDIHHEGEERVEVVLCPNHHALLTRGLTSLEELKV